MTGSAKVRRKLRNIAAAIAVANFVFIIGAVSAGVLFVGAAALNRGAGLAANAIGAYAADHPHTWWQDRAHLTELAGIAVFAPTGDDAVAVTVRHVAGTVLAARGAAPDLASRVFVQDIVLDGAVIGSVEVKRSAMPFVLGMTWIAGAALVLSVLMFFAVHWLAVRVIVRREEELVAVNHEAVDRAAQARESERRLRLIADGVPLVVLYIDSGRFVRFANKEGEIWFGRAYGHIVGQPLASLLPDAFSVLQPHVHEVLAGEGPATVETAITFPDGRTRETLVKMIPHRDDDGAIVGFFAALIDLTAPATPRPSRADRTPREPTLRIVR